MKKYNFVLKEGDRIIREIEAPGILVISDNGGKTSVLGVGTIGSFDAGRMAGWMMEKHGNLAQFMEGVVYGAQEAAGRKMIGGEMIKKARH